MALPCICYQCAKCLSLESLKDPICLFNEEQNCKDRSCNNCTFTCSRYTEALNFEKRNQTLQLLRDDLLNPL